MRKEHPSAFACDAIVSVWHERLSARVFHQASGYERIHVFATTAIEATRSAMFGMMEDFELLARDAIRSGWRIALRHHFWFCWFFAHFHSLSARGVRGYAITATRSRSSKQRQ